jgi:hypothetical protein
MAVGPAVKSYLVRYKDAGGPLIGVINASRNSNIAARAGLPFGEVDSATVGDQVYQCFVMVDHANLDPAAYFKLVSLPFPADTEEEEIIGQSCRELARKRFGVEFGIDAVATEFSLWLLPSQRSPDAAQFDRALTSALVAAGVSARRADAPLFSRGTARADRAVDGTGFLTIAGEREAMIEMRRLSAATCSAIFGVAATLKLDLKTSQTDLMVLDLPGVEGPLPVSGYKTVAVTSAADLCDVLRRGFDEWRAAAAEMPPDMSDLDGQNNSLGN